MKEEAFGFSQSWSCGFRDRTGFLSEYGAVGLAGGCDDFGISGNAKSGTVNASPLAHRKIIQRNLVKF